VSVASGAAVNFLFLVPKEIHDTKMSRVRFEEVEALRRSGDQKNAVLTSGPGWPDWPDGLQPLDYVTQRLTWAQRNAPDQVPHLVLSYKVEGLRGSPVPVAVIFHETYNWSQTLREIRDTGATLVIFTYQNDLAQYERTLTEEGRALVSIPHSADPVIYRDYATEALMPRRVTDPMLSLAHYQSPFDPGYKDIDVLVVGNLAQDFYPFRARLARLAQREIRKRGYRVMTLAHPGFTLPARAGTAVGADYAQMLNRAKLVMTCTGRHHYAFCKLVEIPLCWSLPVSDLPAERQGFFRQTMLNVEMWHTDREILFHIEQVLDDDALLQRLTTIAHDKVAQRLTMPHWAERFTYWARRHVWRDSPTAPTPSVSEEDMV
jgi:hypothetical protein